MEVDQLRQAFDRGETAVCGWLSVDSGYLAEVLSCSGFDAVTVDLQHGMFGLDQAITLLQAVSAGRAAPLARCPSHDAATIGKLLDAGAQGVICPGVDTPEQAAGFVAACRYPPAGLRSYGPARALLRGAYDVREADASVLTWAMIESAPGLDHLDAILATDGLDAVFVGPNDLALALGEQPGQAQPPAPVMAALEHIARRAARAHRWAGAYASDAAGARRLVDLGYQLVVPGNDVGILRTAVGERLALVRGAGSSTSSGY